MELTIKYRNKIDSELAQRLNKQKRLNKTDRLGILSSYFQLEIDSGKVESNNWRFSNFPESNFLGLVNIISIHDLDKGEHTLFVRRNGEVYFKIPFWKD